MKEDEIIELFQASGPNRIPLDDCAVIPTPDPGEELLVTTDSMTEGTHFQLAWSTPEILAQKLFQINLSDLAVSGGVPGFALLNLGLPPSAGDDFIRAFAATLSEELLRHDCPLIGGDTFRSNHLELTLTLGGSARRHLKREGGRTGDTLFLTGNVGLALAGYRHLQGMRTLPESLVGPGETLRELAVRRHLRPQARYDWARQLVADHRVHAALDVSDGIQQDAFRLALASRLTLDIAIEKIPILEELKAHLTSEEAVCSGEEYEILFLADPDADFPFPCSRIGQAREMEPGLPLQFFKRGRPIHIDPGGYRHFFE